MASSTQNPVMDEANLLKIQHLLKAKDDTQRFVGLALLKSLLDNSPQIRQDEVALQELWSSISSKFLDRLLRTGSSPTKDNAKEMLDLVVSVLYIFSVLLPSASLSKSKFTGRVQGLVAAVLYSSKETTELILQLLYTLSNTQDGAEALLNVDDLSPLTEVATVHPLVLDTLSHAWFRYMTVTENKSELSQRINSTISKLVTSFTGTDAVTLLEMLGSFLRQADSAIIPRNPNWLKTVVVYIQHLVTSRPTPEARSAYTNSAASLLQTYPDTATTLLFTDDSNSEKPFAYLFVNLLLIDIRSTIPSLLNKLNDTEYPRISRRLASAFDSIGIFIGYLVRCLEDDFMQTLVMTPDNLLKIRKSMSETMSVTIEFLRDRWDASVAGAMGLHPDARSSTAETSTGTHFTLTWDSMKNIAEEDPFILSSLRALALWLREDENIQLRKEATGLTDVFLELYQASSDEKLDFRSPAVVAFEALVTLDKGRDAILRNDGWALLTKDLASTLQAHREATSEAEAIHVIDIVRVLLAVAENEKSGTLESWMDLVTSVAAWDVPEAPTSSTVLEAHIAVLQLCCTLISGANGGIRSRYRHSIHAIAGIASRVNQTASAEFREQMDDVLQTLKEVSD